MGIPAASRPASEPSHASSAVTPTTPRQRGGPWSPGSPATLSQGVPGFRPVALRPTLSSGWPFVQADRGGTKRNPSASRHYDAQLWEFACLVSTLDSRGNSKGHQRLVANLACGHNPAPDRPAQSSPRPTGLPGPCGPSRAVEGVEAATGPVRTGRCGARKGRRRRPSCG